MAQHETTADAARNAAAPVTRMLPRNTVLFIVALTVLASYLAGIRFIAPFGYTEGLYTEIAREMLRHGHWIVPHLDGAPYIEKPPLLYWLEAGLFAVLGAHVWTARLVSVAAALSTCAVLWRGLARAGAPAIAGFAAVILASSAGWVVMAHVATFDMLLAATTGTSLIAFLVALETDRSRRLWRLLGWLAATAAFFAKGPVGPVLVGLVLTAWLLAERRPRRLLELFDPFGAALFAAAIGGWSLAAAERQPGFLHQFYWVEQFGRFLGTRWPRDYSTGPWWYYLPWIVGGAAPWCLAAPLAARHHVPYFSRRERRLLSFGLVWAAVVLAFFSASTDKAAQYLLPAVPGLAIAAAVPIAHWARRRSPPNWSPLIPVALLGFAGLAAGLLIPGVHEAGLACLGLAALAGIGGFLSAAAGQRRLALTAAALLVSVLVLAAMPLEARDRSAHSLQPVAARIAHSAHPRAPLIFYRHYDPFAMLPLRLHRRAWIYDPGSAELAFAESRNDGGFPFASGKRLAALANASGAWVVADRHTRPPLRTQLPAHCLTRVRRRDGVVLAWIPPGCLPSSG